MKLFAFVKRKDGMSREAFLDYWRGNPRPAHPRHPRAG